MGRGGGNGADAGSGLRWLPSNRRVPERVGIAGGDGGEKWFRFHVLLVVSGSVDVDGVTFYAPV